MAETHVVSALRKKRVEIAGIINDLDKRGREWRRALGQLDATIGLFSQELDPKAIPPKRIYRQSRYVHGKELARFCLDELRKANGEPITARAICAAAIKANDLPDNPPRIGPKRPNRY